METKKWHESKAITFSLSFIIATFIVKQTIPVHITWGIIVWIWAVPLLILLPFLAGLIHKSLSKGRFRNKNGKFRKYDIVIDRGSEVRPEEPGVLKHDIVEGWFIIYLDGFEWKLSEFKNIERF